MQGCASYKGARREGLSVLITVLSASLTILLPSGVDKRGFKGGMRISEFLPCLSRLRVPSHRNSRLRFKLKLLSLRSDRPDSGSYRRLTSLPPQNPLYVRFSGEADLIPYFETYAVAKRAPLDSDSTVKLAGRSRRSDDVTWFAWVVSAMGSYNSCFVAHRLVVPASIFSGRIIE